MCQSLSRYYITDSIVARYIGLVELIDLNFVSISFDTYCFQTNIFDIRFDTYCRKKNVCFKNFFTFSCFYISFYSFSFGIYFSYFRRSHYIDTHFLEALFKLFGDFFILYRDNIRHELNHSHFSTHRVIEVSKFDTYGTTTYNNHLFRLFRESERLAVANDFFTILRKCW